MPMKVAFHPARTLGLTTAGTSSRHLSSYEKHWFSEQSEPLESPLRRQSVTAADSDRFFARSWKAALAVATPTFSSRPTSRQESPSARSAATRETSTCRRALFTAREIRVARSRPGEEQQSGTSSSQRRDRATTSHCTCSRCRRASPTCGRMRRRPAAWTKGKSRLPIAV